MDNFFICCIIFYQQKKESEKNAATNACNTLTLNLLKDAAKNDEFDYSVNFDNLFSKMDDFDKFFRNGEISYNILKYVPALANAAYQGQLEKT